MGVGQLGEEDRLGVTDHGAFFQDVARRPRYKDHMTRMYKTQVSHYHHHHHTPTKHSQDEAGKHKNYKTTTINAPQCNPPNKPARTNPTPQRYPPPPCTQNAAGGPRAWRFQQLQGTSCHEEN